MGLTEIKIGGLGGQGVILSAIIIGKAAALFDKKQASMTQSFGPEARGSACSAQVIVSDERIDYPYVTKPDVLIVMSQEAYNKFVPDLKDDGILCYEEDLVKPGELPPTVKAYKFPATRVAEELGRRMVLNIAMVGFFAAVSNVVQEDAMRQSVVKSVPPGTEDLNLKAFSEGLKRGKADLERLATV